MTRHTLLNVYAFRSIGENGTSLEGDECTIPKGAEVVIDKREGKQRVRVVADVNGKLAWAWMDKSELEVTE
jgi:hypothetical protein